MYRRVLLPLIAICLGDATATSAISAVVISQNGSAYTSASASSVYPFVAGYGPENLFNGNPVVGAEMQSGADSDAGFSYAGDVFSEGYVHYVEFELDQSYLVGSLFYANRDFENHHDFSKDKTGMIDIWTGASAFAPADPGTSPDATVVITNGTNDAFEEYLLGTTISGRYFLVRFSNPSYTPILNGVIGGAELRLGQAAVPEPSMLLILPLLALAAPLVVRGIQTVGCR
jgi:hypothetical protein